MVFLVESIEVGDLVLWVGDARAAVVDQFSCVLIVTDRAGRPVPLWTVR
jgi:hypothetical protein